MNTFNAQSTDSPSILTVNGGSSSIKFALFTSEVSPQHIFSGQVERIGTADARLSATRPAPEQADNRPLAAANFRDGVQHILAYLKERMGVSTVAAVGHRIVHGGIPLLDNQLVTPDLIAELRRNQPFDLAHLPREIALLEEFHKAFPTIPQIACFDTAFHREMPHIAQLLPIPRRYHHAGVRRFGFHGLSYTYLMSELKALATPDVADSRLILAHLGSGASMAAVHSGKPIDTTMAFTPTSGLMMGTRPGDLDPGLLVYLMKEQRLSADDMDKFISEQCGLLGVSETSSDMRDLLNRRATDPRADDAVALFCYQARKQLCGLVSTLGGLDMLVFSGGIGQHAPEIRAGICDGLAFLGVRLDPARNARGADVISPDQARVVVRIIATDEEVVIARSVGSYLHGMPLPLAAIPLAQ